MKLFWVLASFLVVAFGQPAQIPFLGIVSSICGFALFWHSMIQFSSRFWIATFWFAAVQSVQLFWMASPHYMGLMILVVYAALILAMGMQFGLLSYFFFSSNQPKQAFTIAGAWILLEWSRLFVLTGFPFNPVGLSMTDSVAVQWAAIGGVFGLSFWVILTNVFCFNALVSRQMRPAIICAIVAFIPYFFGWIHPVVMKKWWMTPAQDMRIALIQTALFPEQRTYTRLSPKSYVDALVQWERVWDLIPSDEKYDLIVLPEAAFPYGASRPFIQYENLKKAWVKRFGEEALSNLVQLQSPFAHRENIGGKAVWKVTHAFIGQSVSNQLEADLIVGLDDEDSSGKYNAAFHFRPHQMPDRYEKRILVPVSEYLPLEKIDLLSVFYAKQYNIFDSLVAGSHAKVFSAKLPIGPSICYEEMFGSVMRQMRLNGAELFVNVTNDVWYYPSRLPEQHFHHGRIRAAENGVYLLRSGNTGVTGGVDCFGKPLASLPVSETQAGLLELNLSIQSYPTLYTFWGDWAFIVLGGFFVVFDCLKKLLPRNGMLR